MDVYGRIKRQAQSTLQIVANERLNSLSDVVNAGLGRFDQQDSQSILLECRYDIRQPERITQTGLDLSADTLEVDLELLLAIDHRAGEVG